MRLRPRITTFIRAQARNPGEMADPISALFEPPFTID